MAVYIWRSSRDQNSPIKKCPETTSASRSQCLQGAIHGVWSERGIDLVWPDSTYRMAFRRRNFGKYCVWDERKHVLYLQLGDYWFHGVAKRLSRLGIYTWHSAVLAFWNLYVAFSCSCVLEFIRGIQLFLRLGIYTWHSAVLAFLALWCFLDMFPEELQLEFFLQITYYRIRISTFP